MFSRTAHCLGAWWKIAARAPSGLSCAEPGSTNREDVPHGPPGVGRARGGSEASRLSVLPGRVLALGLVLLLACDGGVGASDGGGAQDAASDLGPSDSGIEGADVGGAGDTLTDAPAPEDSGDIQVLDVPDTEAMDAEPDMADEAGVGAPDAKPDIAPPCTPALCDDDDPCTDDLCVEGACTHHTVSCDDGDPCTEDLCAGGACTASLAPSGAACCYEGVLLQSGFEGSSTGGFFIADLATSAEPAIVWQPDDARAHGGTSSLYFGVPGEHTFANGLPVKASATSKPLTLPSGRPLALSFWAWLDVEEGKSWDVLTVSVIRGESIVPVWAKGYDTPLLQWFRVSVDLSAFANETVQIMLVFDSVDASLNEGEGVYVDDLRLLALCTAPPCAVDADCDDGLACTEETCDGGACAWGVSALCCISDADCNDADDCTIDICDPVGGCGHVAVANPLCCNSTADCDDGNACTVDSCTVSECKHTVSPDKACCAKKADCDDGDTCTVDSCDAYQCFHVNTCCLSDAECDDGDTVCTNDACVNGACVFAPTGVDGCCDEAPALWSFDGGDEGWTFSNTAGPDKGFQVWSSATKTKSPPGALYYGSPAKGSFDFGTSSGSATSPPVTLDSPGSVTLSFSLYIDTESGETYDGVTLWVVPEEGKAVQVWLKTYNTPQSSWSVQSVNLSAWAGKTVQVRFEMDTKDSAANGGLGVIVDDLGITNTCVAKGCGAVAECSDSLKETTDQCVAGSCSYKTP